MTWILTRSGVKFDLLAPTAAMINPVDIAHSLSMQCRFNGHTEHFYSVAQHSCIVADLVPEEHQLAALLHDAPEAYVGDLVRPLKVEMREYSIAMGIEPIYQAVEHRIWLAICEHFQINPELPPCVHDADMIALATERRDLMPDHSAPWACLAGTQPRAERIEPLPPSAASIMYFNRLMELLSSTNRGRSVA